MNPTQIAAEAWNDIRNNVVVCSCSPEQYEQAVSIIQAAIEKACEETAEHFRQGLYAKLDQALSAAHASEPPSCTKALKAAEGTGSEEFWAGYRYAQAESRAAQVVER